MGLLSDKQETEKKDNLLMIRNTEKNSEKKRVKEEITSRLKAEKYKK